MRGVEAWMLIHWGTHHLGEVIGLTWVVSRSGMLNFHWPSAHPGSLGRLSGALNSDWLSRWFLLLIFLRDFLGCGGAKGAPGDSLVMADAGVSSKSTMGRRDAGGAGS